MRTWGRGDILPLPHSSRGDMENTFALDNWVTPATAYPEEQVANYCIGKHTLDKGSHRYYGMDGYDSFTVENPIELTALKELRNGEWKTWMLDSPTDYRAMQKYAKRAYGRVLTTGLGLGLLIHELCKNDKVKSITVVEISPPVFVLVRKYLPEDGKIEVVVDNFWKFIFLDDSKWDTIIVDLWVFSRIGEQMEQYRADIVPANKQLRAKYPEAQILFHGFAGLPTLEQLDRDVLNRKDTEELIYGLGG